MRHGPDELGNPGHRGLCAYEWGQIAKSTHNHLFQPRLAKDPTQVSPSTQVGASIVRKQPEEA
jgi:hypothetical protein